MGRAEQGTPGSPVFVQLAGDGLEEMDSKVAFSGLTLEPHLLAVRGCAESPASHPRPHPCLLLP